MKKTNFRLFLAFYLSLLYLGAFLVFLESYLKYGLFGSLETGKIFGLWALTGLAIQPLLSARFFIQKLIGLDLAIKFHRINAKLIFLFAAAHPIFLLYQSAKTVNVLQVYLSLTTANKLGSLALFLLVIILVTSLYSSKVRLSYERWRYIHKIGYLVVALAFVHSFFSGSDILSRNPLYYFWLFLFSLGTLSFIIRFLTRFVNQKEFVVKSTTKETKDVRTLCLVPKKKEMFDYKPGQFAFVTFKSKDLPVEEHHFTITNAPGEGKLCFSIKASGDFTSQLSKIKRGDRAIIDGPYGSFTNSHLRGQFLFIAGGIGITPIASMLRSMAKRGGQDAVLIYANKFEKEVAFKHELEVLSRKKWFKVVFVYSQEKVRGAEFGRIDGGLIKKKVPDFSTRKILIVGPPPMMDSIKKDLLSLGVTRPNIFTEKFSLRD